MTTQFSRGRTQTMTVIVLIALLGTASQLLRIQTENRVVTGLSISVTLLLATLLLYSGRAPLRAVVGILLLAGAMAFVILGLTRAIDGVTIAWPFPVMSAVLAYCCWVILFSKSARQFLGENRLRFQNARTSTVPPLSGRPTGIGNANDLTQVISHS